MAEFKHDHHPFSSVNLIEFVKGIPELQNAVQVKRISKDTPWITSLKLLLLIWGRCCFGFFLTVNCNPSKQRFTYWNG